MVYTLAFVVRQPRKIRPTSAMSVRRDVAGQAGEPEEQGQDRWDERHDRADLNDLEAEDDRLDLRLFGASRWWW
jgi:hypothetical protein